MEHLNLQQLSERTGISEAKLQDCMNMGLTFHDWMVPEFDELYPSLIDAFTGIFATLAVRFAEIGCDVNGVRWLMRGINAFIPREHNSLNLPHLGDAIGGNQSAVVLIGDGTHVKWKLNHEDSGWHRFVPSVERDESAQPVVVVAVDVGRVRDKVLGISS